MNRVDGGGYTPYLALHTVVAYVRVTTMAYRVLSLIVAVVLLVAAGLKMFGMSVSPVPQTGILHHPALTMAIVEWEVVLAGCLLLVRGGDQGWFATSR